MTAPSKRRLAGADAPSEHLTHIPYLLGAISNVLTIGGSRLYRRAFGVGTAEWRLMWVLGYEGPLNASRASYLMRVDKAATSRTVGSLARLGLVAVTVDPADTRQRTLALTEQGWTLHARIMDVARERERRLHAAFSHDEILVLKGLLVRLLQQAPQVNAMDPSAVGPATSRPGNGGRGRSARSPGRKPPDGP